MIYGQCIRCRKIINYDKIRYCDSCNDYYYHLVKDYLYEHQQESVSEICKKLNVPKVLSDYYIANEKFKATNNEVLIDKNNISPEIDRNKNLQTARALQALLQEKQNQNKTEDFSGAKMYFIGSKKR